MNQGRRPLSSLTRSPGRGLCVQPARHPGERPRGARPAGDDDDDNDDDDDDDDDVDDDILIMQGLGKERGAWLL